MHGTKARYAEQSTLWSIELSNVVHIRQHSLNSVLHTSRTINARSRLRNELIAEPLADRETESDDERGDGDESEVGGGVRDHWILLRRV